MLSRAIRSWMLARGTAALAVLAFAIGIGAATAMYTVVESVLLRPLPYAGGSRWVTLYSGRTTEPRQFGAHSLPDLDEFRRRSTSFGIFGVFTFSTKSLTSPGDPRHVTIVSVAPDLVPALGVAPAMGHWFTDNRGAAITDALWRALGANPNIVGTSMTLDRVVYTITAVMPPRFVMPVSAPGTEGVATDVWIALDPTSVMDPNAGLFFAYARLKPGVTLDAATAEVKGIGADMAARDPIGHQAYMSKLEDLQDVGVRDQRPTLLLLLAASVLLLVIACANVAGLLLVRSVTRAREIATRIALGASAGRLGWQFFLEGALVSIAGAALGILVSMALVRAVALLGPEFVPRTSVVEMDATVPLVALALGLLTAIASTLAPLWQTRQTSPADALEAGVRVSVGARARRISQALVVAEIATAFALLVAGGALALRLRTLGTTSPGFDPDHLLAFSVDVPAAMGPDGSMRPPKPYLRQLADAVSAAPGVMMAGYSNQLPLDGCCWSTTIEREGHPPGNTERTSFIVASPSYFTTMRIPLMRGRFLTDADVSEDPMMVVLNQAAATRYWGTDDPVGGFGRLGDTKARFEVVGVVGDVKNNALGQATVPEIYLSTGVGTANPARFVVRSILRADALLPGIRRAIHDVDPALPIHSVTTVEDVMKGSLAAERVSAGLSGGFALTALLMAMLGIYGVVSYAVRQRTVEIGTRMAIGASSGDILRLVVGNGLTLAVVGMVLGTVVVLGASPWIARVLELQTFSWTSLFGSAAVIGVVATSATGVPAWRAASMPPHLAVRDEAPATWEIARAEMRRALAALSRRIPFTRVGAGNIERDLLAGFVDAARHAGSHAEAMQQALDMVREQIGASSAVLLERSTNALRQAQGNDDYVCAATSPPAAQAVAGVQQDGWLSRRLSAYGQALAITAGDLDAALQWSATHHPAVRDEIAAIAAAQVRVAVALRAREDVIGILLLGPPADEGSSYGRSERAALTACAPQLALMVENGGLTRRIVAQEKVRRDLALAAEVQRGLLPDAPPERDAAVVAAVSLPARSIGGDYFDFIDVGDRRLGIALADIAGKGIPAALIMSSVRMALRVLASEPGVSLPDLVARMNHVLHEATPSNSYATFFYARLDDSTNELRYINAGHLPPILVRSGQLQELTTGGSVIGLLDGMSYEEGGVALQSGDVLVAFTDGVPEAQNAAEEEFGDARLKELLAQVAHLDAPEIAARLLAALKEWIQDASQYDDLTFIVLKVRDVPPASR
ncbi:MAG TPA: ADOP family duplicated permease [Vicinamibacterales bacterium]|nr:ADOP family duplicated permease [Vicinamibacterales bacterium]